MFVLFLLEVEEGGEEKKVSNNLLLFLKLEKINLETTTRKIRKASRVLSWQNCLVSLILARTYYFGGKKNILGNCL